MEVSEVDYDYVFCLRCNRRLTDKKSAERGLGPVCYKKDNEEMKRHGDLFEESEE